MLKLVVLYYVITACPDLCLMMKGLIDLWRLHLFCLVGKLGITTADPSVSRKLISRANGQTDANVEHGCFWHLLPSMICNICSSSKALTTRKKTLLRYRASYLYPLVLHGNDA